MIGNKSTFTFLLGIFQKVVFDIQSQVLLRIVLLVLLVYNIIIKLLQATLPYFKRFEIVKVNNVKVATFNRSIENDLGYRERVSDLV